MPPALSETSITGGPAAVLEARRRRRPRSRVVPSRRANGELGAREGGSIRSSSDWSTARTPAPCGPRRPRSSSASSSASSFDDVRRALAGHQRRVAGGLAQAQQRLERLRSRRLPSPSSAEQRDDVLARRRADGVVDGALAVVELDAQDRVGARRQLGRDLVLEAAQHERADALAQRRGGARRAPRRSGARSDPRSRERPPSRPRLVKCIRLHSSSSRFSTGVPVSASRNDARQRVRGARGLAVGVLDRLRLVEDHGVPARAPTAPSRRGAAARRW